MFSGILISVGTILNLRQQKGESKKCQREKGYLLQMLKFSDAYNGSLKSEGKDDSDSLGFKESHSQYCKYLSMFELWLELALLGAKRKGKT